LTVALLWFVFARDTEPAQSGGGAGIIDVFRSLAGLRNVRILLAMALFSFAVFHGFGGWLPKILETHGMSAARAGLVASVPLATAIAAVPLIPRLVPRFWRGRAIAAFALVTAVNILVVAGASGALLYAALILLGATTSSMLPLMLLILMDSREVGTKYMGSAGGMFFCVAEIGGFTGPLIMGVLVDVTGTFTVGAIFCATLCLAILAMTGLLENSD
jgi:cyanate permease